MHVVARRDGLDVAKARMLKASGEHDMSVQPLLPRCHLRGGHPNLKSNAGFLRQNPHRADRLHRLDKVVEKRVNFRRFSAKVMSKVIAAARVRLIAVRKVTPAGLATPQRWQLLRRLTLHS